MPGVNDNIPDVHPDDIMRASWGQAVAESVNRINRFPRGGLDFLLANAAGVFSGEASEDDILVFNQSSFAIPPYGICVPNNTVTSDSTPVPCVKTPGAYGVQNDFYVNGPSQISASGYGAVQNGAANLYIAAYDSTDGTPSPGSNWGPRNSTSCLLKKDTGGFIIVGVWDATKHYVLVRGAPMLKIRVKPTGNVLAGNGGTCDVWVGTLGGETQAAGNPQVSAVFNFSSCTVKGSTLATADWIQDCQGWAFSAFQNV